MPKNDKQVSWDDFLNTKKVGTRSTSPNGQTFEILPDGILLLNGVTYVSGGGALWGWSGGRRAGNAAQA